MPQCTTQARDASHGGLSNSAYLAAGVDNFPLVSHAGRVVQVQWRGLGSSSGYGPVGGGTRGEIEGLTAPARRRMLRSVSACAWDAYPGDKLFSSMTYPAEFPLDGQTCKAHLQAWRRRFQRTFGAPVAAWKQEFQSRGAPHYHLYHVAPDLPLRDFQQWLSRSWYDVVDSGDPDHLRAGTSCEVARDNCAFYFAGYTSGGKNKEYQHVVPEGFQNVGRFWGLWNIKPEWQRELLSAQRWFMMRRLLVRYRQSRARRAKHPYRYHSPDRGGLWVIGGRASDEFYGELVRALEVCA